MTGKLDSEARNNLVKYRMQRAFETLAEEFIKAIKNLIEN